jgi:hypothetical protein
MAQQYVAKSSAIAARWLEDRVMIMVARDSALFELNPTASAIWQAADGQTTLPSIVTRLFSGLDTDFETVQRDAEKLVGELESHGILILLDEPLDPQSVVSASVRVGRQPARPVGAGKRPYEKPAFRYEHAFETMALSCGKVQGAQGQCQLTRKVS